MTMEYTWKLVDSSGKVYAELSLEDVAVASKEVALIVDRLLQKTSFNPA